MSWLAWSNSSELMISLEVPGSHLRLSNCAQVARSTQEKDYCASLNWPICTPNSNDLFGVNVSLLLVLVGLIGLSYDQENLGWFTELSMFENSLGT